jgi:hypothetical protein
MTDADLAAMAQFGKTMDELTEDEFVAFLKTPGAAQFVRLDTRQVQIEGDS